MVANARRTVLSETFVTRARRLIFMTGTSDVEFTFFNKILRALSNLCNFFAVIFFLRPRVSL